MDISKISKALKVDEDKILEALPAMATIAEEAELIDYIAKLGQPIDSAKAFKIVIRIVARMKSYNQEFDEAISLLFGVEMKEANNADKIKMLKEIMIEKDLTDFF